MLPSQEQLDWQASCYLLGDLSLAEQNAFEADLAVSQPAREALARAVELHQAASAALALSAVVEIPVRPAAGGVPRAAPAVAGSHWAWITAGGVAALCLAVFAAFSGGLHFSPAVNDELAASWTELSRLAADGDAAVAETVAYSAPLEPANLTTPVAVEAELQEAGEAPSWMTAAVYGLAGCPLDSDKRTEDAVDSVGPLEN